MRIASILLLTTFVASPALALSDAEVDKVLATLEERRTSGGDYKSLVFIEHKQRDKNDIVTESVIYRRDTDDRLMILNLKPKAEAGKGYLMIDKNLFLYDPTVGKWERRTQRERINGTSMRQSDFDDPKYREKFTAKFIGDEKLGRFAVWHIQLTAREGADVAFPIVHMWIDQTTTNVLKTQDRALSGKLMRTSYTPRWDKMYSESKGGDVYVPREFRVFDEIEKGNRTIVLIRKTDLRPLQKNMFTKAWLESRSR
jgi:hypothetical protein